MPVPVVLISDGTSPLRNIFHFSKIDPAFLFHSISLPIVVLQKCHLPDLFHPLLEHLNATDEV